MKKKKIIFISILTLLLIGAISSITYYVRPIVYLSDIQLRTKLLTDTPLGSSKQFVSEYVKKKGYKIDQCSRDLNWGKNYIHVELGEYRVVFVVDVGAAWIFDPNNKLTDISVWKDTDAL